MSGPRVGDRVWLTPELLRRTHRRTRDQWHWPPGPIGRDDRPGLVLRRDARSLTTNRGRNLSMRTNTTTERVPETTPGAVASIPGRAVRRRPQLILGPRPIAGRGRNAARLALAGFWLLMAGYNVVVTLPGGGELYEGSRTSPGLASTGSSRTWCNRLPCLSPSL